MKKCALVLTVLVALAGFVSPAQADSVDVGYSIAVSIGIPGLGVAAIGAPSPGFAVVNYKNLTVGNPGNSLLGSVAAFTPVHATARLRSMAFAGTIGFVLFGDTLTAPAFSGSFMGNFGPGPANTLLSGGTLMIGFAGGALAPSLHCTGATCGGLIPFLPSVPTPFGFAAAGVLSGMAATAGSSLLPVFSMSGTLGTLLGVPVTAMITFAEAPLFGGFSRHLIPEPGTAALLGLGLVGMAAAGRRLRR